MNELNTKEYHRKDLKQIYGEKLKDLRFAKKMTMKDVEVQTNISSGTISNYENGNSMPALDNLEKLLFTYETSIMEFLGIEEASYKKDLDVFERYGLSEGFLRALTLDRYHKQNLAENINLIFGNTMYSMEIIKNLNLFFDYELHKKIYSSIQKGLPFSLARGDTGRIFLDSIAQALTSIFQSKYSDSQTDSLKRLIEAQSNSMNETIEEYMHLIEEHNKKPFGTP